MRNKKETTNLVFFRCQVLFLFVCLLRSQPLSGYPFILDSQVGLIMTGHSRSDRH